MRDRAGNGRSCITVYVVWENDIASIDTDRRPWSRRMCDSVFVSASQEDYGPGKSGAQGSLRGRTSWRNCSTCKKNHCGYFCSGRGRGCSVCVPVYSRIWGGERNLVFHLSFGFRLL